MPFKKGHIPWNKGRKGLVPWNKGLKGAQVPWNKGLTKGTDERVKRYGEKGAKSRNWKGKTYGEIYGIDKALEIKKSQTKARKGKPHPIPWLKGVPRTEEVRRKISEAQKGEKSHMFGKHQSEETKRKKSESLKGRITSPKTLFKKGHPSYVREGDKHPFWGKHHILETRKKISKKLTGKHPSEETIKKMSETQKRIGNRPPSWKDNPHQEETRGKLRAARLHQVFPQKDTSIEIALQTILTKAGIKFKTHHPIKGQPDIFIEPNICIFVDGCWHHQCPKCFPIRSSALSVKNKPEQDAKITKELQSRGYIVLRLWEHEINQLPKDEIVRRVLNQTKPVITPAA